LKAVNSSVLHWSNWWNGWNSTAFMELSTFLCILSEDWAGFCTDAEFGMAQ
jgi:hypothetical protein